MFYENVKIYKFKGITSSEKKTPKFTQANYIYVKMSLCPLNNFHHTLGVILEQQGEPFASRPIKLRTHTRGSFQYPRWHLSQGPVKSQRRGTGNLNYRAAPKFGRRFDSSAVETLVIWQSCWITFTTNLAVLGTHDKSFVHIKMFPFPDSMVHGANMRPIWGRQDPGGPHAGPMNFAIWVVV